jgi:hypothetical protein
MKNLGIRSVAAVLGLGLALTLAAQDAPKKKAAAKPAAPDEKAMMEAWQKSATPGEQHKKLDAIVGTFDAKVRATMDPSKPPEDSSGTSVNSWALGNRYVEQKYEGSFNGQPFNGIGYTGYDNVQKKYVSVWMDDMGTGMMFMTAAPDASGKGMTSKTTVWEPMTGKPTPIETKMIIADNDHHKFEMWGKGPDGKTQKMMEIEYTRKK